MIYNAVAAQFFIPQTLFRQKPSIKNVFYLKNTLTCGKKNDILYPLCNYQGI